MKFKWNLRPEEPLKENCLSFTPSRGHLNPSFGRRLRSDIARAPRGRTRGLNCSDNSTQALIPWYIGGSRRPNSIKIITEKTHREIVFQNT